MKKLVVFRELEKELISVVIAVKMQVRALFHHILGPAEAHSAWEMGVDPPTPTAQPQQYRPPSRFWPRAQGAGCCPPGPPDRVPFRAGLLPFTPRLLEPMSMAPRGCLGPACGS